MEEIFSHMDGRFEVTLTDSTMMWIVHCAMNRAQEKMKTKKGVLERLNEISKFYELAVMQLEGCLSFVQAETERNSFLDSSHEQVLADLREIKDRLQGRLEESEMAITKKDRELTERLENEGKMRKALEMEEGEIVSLGVNVNLEEGKMRNDDSDGGSCMMKSWADQQMLSINERLDPPGEVPHSGIDSKKVEEMGSDIDILKQTLDVAFGKIQSVLFYGEMGPKEQQWKLTTEKEMMSILVKSYMREFQENIEAEVKMQGKQTLKQWFEHWSQLMNEVTSLRHELRTCISQNEFPGTLSEDSSNSSPILSQEMVEKPSSEESGHEKLKRSLAEIEKLQKEEGDEDKDGSNFVAKMVRKHQSIIRQKSEELNISKYGLLLLQEKKSSPTKKDQKEPTCMKERMQNIYTILDNLINWNSKVCESLFEPREVEKSGCNLESANLANEEKDDRSVLNKDIDNEKLGDKFLDEGMVEEFHDKNVNFEIEKQIEEDVLKYYLKEVTCEWNEVIERNSIECHIRDTVYFTFFSEAKAITCSIQDSDEIENTIREDIVVLVYKEMLEEHNKTLEDYSASMEYRAQKNQDNFFNHLQLFRTESHLKEDICKIVLRGTLMEWKMELYDYCIENFIREQLQQFIVIQTMKDAIILPMEEDALSSTMMMNQVNEVPCEEKLIKILLESLLTCFEAEENLMLSARSEIKEHSRQFDLGSERGELHEHEIFEDLIIGEEQTFCSLTSKVENALQQLGISKAILSELGTTLGLRLCKSEKYLDQASTEEGNSKASYADFLPLLNFLQTFTEFEGMVNHKLEIEIVRLGNMKYCLDIVIELVNCLKRKESIFQMAFTRRCQNLHRAELEVDLLGDQVDALLSLLEKIYATLYQYAPILQQHFEVSNMLELIKKELTSGSV